MNKKVAIIIPTFNEEQNIEKLIRKINLFLKNPLIVIVDDSSHKKILNIIKKKKLKINYYNRGKKIGRGSAVIFGLKKVINNKKIKAFIEMDADLSHHPNELNRNLKFFFKNNADLLIGSRYLKKSKIVNWPISRRIFSFLANLLARLFIGVPITDYTNGYRIYSKRSCKVIIRKCGKIGDGFIILSEIIQEINWKNFKILEIDSIFINRIRGASSVNTKLILQSLFGLLILVKKKN